MDKNGESKIKIIKFVGRVSSSGNRKLINIPKEIKDEIPENIDHFKVYLVPIVLDDY